MGKSSSSYKKKRAKVSSQDRTTKKSKGSSKSSKYRSKKVRRPDDSLSYSDDHSRSLQSVSSFGSEDDSRSRRARSRARRNVKISKKRARRRSYSSDSSEDSLCGKKRKALKKKNDYEPRKKPSGKKPRRNASVSSISSDSFGCSTCPSGDEIESRRHMIRPGKRSRDESDARKVESGTKRGRYRSPSCSLRSQGSEGNDCQGEEKVVFENSRRRLRSVIALPEEHKHGRWMDNDSDKEEITYDHDDYPSCRSNDSNDGGRKRELDNHLHVVLEKRIGLTSGEEEEALVANVPIRVFGNSSYGFEKDHEVEVKGSNSSCHTLEVGVPLNENQNEVSGAISSQAGEDIESILRQRALENLRKFKGRHPRIPEVTSNQKDKRDNNLKQSSTAKAELVQTEPSKEGGSTVAAAKSSKEDAAEMVGATATQIVEESNGPPVTNSFRSSENLGEELYRTSVGNKTLSAKQDVASVGNSNKEVDKTSVLNEPNLTSLRRHSLKPHWTLTQASASLEPQGKLVLTESRVDKSGYRTAETVTEISNSNGDKSAPGTAQTMTQISNSNGDICASGNAETVTQSSNSSNGEDIHTASGNAETVTQSSNSSNGEDIHTAPEPSGENKPDSEAEDGSQFEQKTMGVMRGGETVQLSYKVYIPKRAPALARRQLKR